MNTKIALSGISILASLALVGGATFALFTDVGTSTNNVFATGNLDLKLSDDTPETDQDDVTASFGGSNLGPGDCTTTQQLRVKNSGTINGDHVEISVANSVTDNGTPAVDPIDQFMMLNLFQYDGGNISVADFNSNGFADLDDLENVGVDNLGLGDLNTDHDIDLSVCLDSSAGDDLQGDSVSSDWTITLNQDATQ
ncbi:hypothetical protein HYT02_04980 [Candidatus Gottesmanbacteria bacterium]|nr:hypothetical protein [Candidatus Gottesmanbacteria bacterium]